MSGTDVSEKQTSETSGCCLSSCEELAAVFRALGHPARLAIVKQLAARKEACCGEIVNHLPLAQSTVSQHLQVLKDAGLLICDTRGRNCHYLLNQDKLVQAEQWAGDFWDVLKSQLAECTAGAAAADDKK
ncbi:metalloregulator ArsR/SmtB family transcription factor [Roseibium sp. CAU 1639]|uniref:Metalloregulator ArsR/SmtB family transcription factor n=2 Tax=Roseibium sediminicola TaxID=2933272 RepID=A0ABT0GYU8_9HYPH|nr:metalloregulator ArsR/SmtB family transcription factor [Roseibium sp. CAU 1639]MCK7614247.1 metalloregulator ArsR/SmtB family transcription factor [Roseibium sp. CAU 1639]